MIPVFTPLVGEEELKNVAKAIKTNWISSKGEFIERFEQGFANYCNVKYGVTTNGGNSSIHLALASLDIGKGDEVIVPNFTMMSPAFSVIYTGAIPVFVDVDEETMTIDVNKIEEKITSKTKAIMAVHIYGHPCEMDKIIEIAEKHNLKVIEDAAEAHGAEYKGKKIGSIGDVACFSFYANKLITTGEGGMLVTNNPKIYEKAKYLRDLALSQKPGERFKHYDIGFNYRMTNLQAAIGCAQLEKIDKFLNIKIKNALLYNLLLKNVEGVILPPEKPYVKNSYWMYAIKIDEEKFGISKKELMEKLSKKGIDSRDFFFPLNKQPCLKKLGIDYQSGENFPISEKLFKQGLYLPSGLNLKEEEIGYICKTIKEIKQGNQEFKNLI